MHTSAVRPRESGTICVPIDDGSAGTRHPDPVARISNQRRHCLDTAVKLGSAAAWGSVSHSTVRRGSGAREDGSEREPGCPPLRAQPGLFRSEHARWFQR